MTTNFLCDVMGGEGRCLIEGTGPPLVFLHGIPDNAEAWSDVISRLSEEHRCFAPDLPGFGATPEPPGFTASLDGMADYLDAVLDAAGAQPPYAMVVHDVGGAFGLASAVRAPQRLSHLVILNTNFFSDRRWHWGARLLRTPVLGELATWFMPRPCFAAALRRASNHGLSEKQIEHSCRHFGPQARRAALRLYRALDPGVFRGWEERLADVSAHCPTTVLWGARDPYLPAAFARRFGAGRVRFYERCGHWPHRESPAQAARDIGQALGGALIR